MHILGHELVAEKKNVGAKHGFRRKVCRRRGCRNYCKVRVYAILALGTLSIESLVKRTR